MREIKFRAWHKADEKMYQIYGFSQSQWFLKGKKFPMPPGAIKLMQYTGLKDKNGKEIYEGDVLYYEDGEFSFTAKVVYNDWGFYLKGIVPNDNYSFQEITGNCVVDAEIIGNIYQHPHLLEGATNGSS